MNVDALRAFCSGREARAVRFMKDLICSFLALCSGSSVAMDCRRTSGGDRNDGFEEDGRSLLIRAVSQSSTGVIGSETEMVPVVFLFIYYKRPVM